MINKINNILFISNKNLLLKKTKKVLKIIQKNAKSNKYNNLLRK